MNTVPRHDLQSKIALHGTFVLTAFASGRSRGESSKTCLRLERDGQAIDVMDEWCVSGHLQQLRLPIKVSAQIQAWKWPDRTFFSLIDITPAAGDRDTLMAAFPREAAVPTRGRLAYRRLQRFLRELKNVHLQSFTLDVLLDPQVTSPFLTLPASLSGYHHGYPAGLLVHSIEMLDAISGFMTAVGSTDQDAVETAQVGYLLHDLGKVRTHRPAVTASDRAQRHEWHTLDLTSRHLDALASSHARSAAWLREIFHRCAQRAAERVSPGFIGARVVTFADGISTQNDRQARLTALDV